MRYNSKLILTLIPMLIFGALVIGACGGDDDEDGATTASPTRPAATATTAAAVPTTAASPTSAPAASPTSPASGGGATSMSIVDFGYSPAQLSGRAGQAIRLNVTNQGALDHTFTIDGVVDSESMGPGVGPRALEFTPSQAGTLTYYCTIHGEATMSGRLTVAAQ
jgi:plastocyanin